MVQQGLISAPQETVEPVQATVTGTSVLDSTSTEVGPSPGMDTNSLSDTITPPNLPAPNQPSSFIKDIVPPTTSNTQKTSTAQNTILQKRHTKSSQKSQRKSPTKHRYEGSSTKGKLEVTESKNIHEKRNKSTAHKKKRRRKKEIARLNREHPGSGVGVDSAGRERGRGRQEERTQEEWLALAGLLSQRANAQRRGRNQSHVLSPHTIVPQYTFLKKRPRRSHEPVPSPMPPPAIAKYQPICEQHTPTGEHPVTRAFKKRSTAPLVPGSAVALLASRNYFAQSYAQRRTRPPESSSENLESSTKGSRRDTTALISQSDSAPTTESSSAVTPATAKSAVTNVTFTSSHQRSSLESSTLSSSVSETTSSTLSHKSPLLPTRRGNDSKEPSSLQKSSTILSPSLLKLKYRFRKKTSNTSSVGKSSAKLPGTQFSNAAVRHDISSENTSQLSVSIATVRNIKSETSSPSSQNFDDNPKLLSSMHHIPCPTVKKGTEVNQARLLYNRLKSLDKSLTKLPASHSSIPDSSKQCIDQRPTSKLSNDQKNSNNQFASAVITIPPLIPSPTPLKGPIEVENKTHLAALLLESDTPGSEYLWTKSESSDGQTTEVSNYLHPSPRRVSQTHTSPTVASGKSSHAVEVPPTLTVVKKDKSSKSTGQPQGTNDSSSPQPELSSKPTQEEIVQRKFSVALHPSPKHLRLAAARRLSSTRILNQSSMSLRVLWRCALCRRQAAVDAGRLRWPVASPAPAMPGDEPWDSCPSCPSFAPATPTSPTDSSERPSPAMSFSAATRHALSEPRAKGHPSRQRPRPGSNRVTNAVRMLCCFFSPEADDG